MIAIHSNEELSPLYYESFIPTLRDNCLKGMKGLVNFFIEVEVDIPGTCEEEVKLIQNSSELTIDMAELILKIWRNKAFQDLAKRAEDAQIQGGIYIFLLSNNNFLFSYIHNLLITCLFSLFLYSFFTIYL
jgi:hypothetical protein